MRYGIFADVHGNLEALGAVLSVLRNERIDTYYCCGDIVGYGADPALCLREIRRMKIQCVAGNHDWAVAQRIDAAHFHEQAQTAVFWTRQHLKAQDQAFLADLPLIFKENDLVLAHGTLHQPDKFYYLMDTTEAQRTFAVMDCSFCFVGHSHVVKMFARDLRGKVVELKERTIKTLSGFRYIVNVGSVGQPRDRDPDAACCIFDDEERTITIKRIPYPVDMAKTKIFEAGLPPELGARLFNGV